MNKIPHNLMLTTSSITFGGVMSDLSHSIAPILASVAVAILSELIKFVKLKYLQKNENSKR